MSLLIGEHDKNILRELAKKVCEISVRPLEGKKKKLWTLHNDLLTNEPLVFIDPENGWNEIFPSNSLKCIDKTARMRKFDLRKRIYHAEVLKDDMVIDNIMPVPFLSHDDGWGVEIRSKKTESLGSYITIPSIQEYEIDFPKIHFPNISIDYEASDDLYCAACEVFGDIMKVTRSTQWWWSLGLTWWYIDLRGLENFLCDFIVEPEWVHTMMNMLCDGVLKRLDYFEANNLLSSNTGNTYTGSGGFGFTNELPFYDETHHVSTMDMWGFVESQETSSISPEMYGEFIFPYHKKIASRFGLNCYGCCEAFEPRWKWIKQLPRLRKVSCSPWSDRIKTAELLGNNYIASYKLSPTPLASANMDEHEVRKNLREVLDNAKNTIPELIMKDNHTLGNPPQNAARWVEIAREEIHRY